MTRWLMNDVKSLSEDLPRWRPKLEKQRDDSGNAHWSKSNLGLALLAGAQGNAEESEQLIKGWLGPEQIDWAERNEFRHEACRVLGMIAATQAAVKCILDGLNEPSHVTPFLEPYLPFYDSIREQPEFIDMLVEIDGAGH